MGAVGALRDFLEDRGELDNTFFLFQQDHGQEQKGTLYEQGTRIFQLVHFPDAFGEAGGVFDGLVSTVDIAPTILDFAGIEPGYGMDGKSWRAAAENRGSNETLRDEWRDRCLVFELEEDRAVRCGCNKLLFIGGSTSTTKERGSNAGFDITENNNYFDLCDGDSSTSIASPGENPETSSINIQDIDLKRLTDTLECHLNKTLPSRLVVPDYSADGCGGTAAPCEDTVFFPQKAGPGVGTERDCAWVLAREKCQQYELECPASCEICASTQQPTTVSPTNAPTTAPTKRAKNTKAVKASKNSKASKTKALKTRAGKEIGSNPFS